VLEFGLAIAGIEINLTGHLSRQIDHWKGSIVQLFDQGILQGMKFHTDCSRLLFFFNVSRKRSLSAICSLIQPSLLIFNSEGQPSIGLQAFN